MTSVTTRAAEAVSHTLSTFQRISGQSLQAVREVHTEGSLDRLILAFEHLSLMVSASEDDDSIGVIVTDSAGRSPAGGMDAGHLEPWNKFLGKCFGWGWVTINQQGYCDGVLLSFEGIVPQVFLHVIASSIKVGSITGISPQPCGGA